jgi:hypothetical protein
LKIPTGLTVRELLIVLREVHERKMYDFARDNGRPVVMGDQLKKHLEELGEMIKAVDRKTPEDPIEEFWDMVFSDMATFLGDDPKYSDDQLFEGFRKCLEKIMLRAGLG